MILYLVLPEGAKLMTRGSFSPFGTGKCRLDFLYLVPDEVPPAAAMVGGSS